MVRISIECDKCHKAITDAAFQWCLQCVNHDGKLLDDGMADDTNYALSDIHLCRACTQKMYLNYAEFLNVEKPEKKEPETKIEVPEKLKKNKKEVKDTKPIDWGKVEALKKAGWSWKKIAGELLNDETQEAGDRLSKRWWYHNNVK